MNTQLSTETVLFHGHQLITAEHQSETYVAMKPICESIGLDWRSQRQRILRNPVLAEGVVMITTPSRGGNQNYTCLPLKLLNGWLFGINSSRAKPELREALEMYQRECYDVLHQYWQSKHSGQGLAVAPSQYWARTFSPEKENDYRTATDALREIIAYNRDNAEVCDRLVYADRTLVDLFTVIQESLPGILRSADLMKKRYFH